MSDGVIRRLVPAFAAMLLMARAAWAGEPLSCRSVRLSDVARIDVAATTGMAVFILEQLGYAPKITSMSVADTLKALHDGNIDAFLGNRMPAQRYLIAPYLADKSIDVLGANLTGAKLSLAVPAYTYDAGLRSFGDIVKYADQLHAKIYSIQPASGANVLLVRMIADNMFGLGDFRLVESSEQGVMLALDRSIKRHKPIVFLAWAPHPMNVQYAIRYLKGGDAVFGPDDGGTTIYTAVRAGYLAACPNAARLFGRLKFSLDMENTLMLKIMDGHEDPAAAGAAWLKSHPEVLGPWLDGVTTFGGANGLKAIEAALQGR